jgi:sarcosine oxidase subunit beta
MVPAHPVMAVTEPLPMFMNLSLGVEGGGIYARQAPRGNCVIGGSRGFALDALRARPSRDAIAMVLRGTVELLPRLHHAQIIRSWSGTEGYLPDHEPVIGPSTTQPGLIHGFGFAGAGFQLGPAVGEVLAELVQGGASSTPITPFSISRFSPVLSPATSTLRRLS